MSELIIKNTQLKFEPEKEDPDSFGQRWDNREIMFKLFNINFEIVLPLNYIISLEFHSAEGADPLEVTCTGDFSFDFSNLAFDNFIQLLDFYLLVLAAKMIIFRCALNLE